MIIRFETDLSVPEPFLAEAEMSAVPREGDSLVFVNDESDEGEPFRYTVFGVEWLVGGGSTVAHVILRN